MITKSEFYNFFKRIPKAELHIHIEAVISKDSIKKLYLKKNGVEFSDAEMKSLFDYSDLNGFIAAFLKVQDLFTSVDDFDLVFEDLKNYLLRNGICYTEAFFAPSAFVKKGFDFSEMMKNFQKNVQKIYAETGITVKLLMDVSRTFGLENSEKNLDMLLSARIPEIIGIGLGGAEAKGPCKDFGPVFDRARKNGLFTVAHAGEDVGPESIWDALRVLHAQRIGHGITAIQDENLMAELSKTQIPVEVCPTSNVFTKKYVKKISEHPVKAFYEHKMMVTIGTDDPLFFGVELLDEYWNLYSKMGFKKSDMKKIIVNGFESSFLSAEEKAEYISSVEKSW